MCVMSMVADHYQDKWLGEWDEQIKRSQPDPFNPWPLPSLFPSEQPDLVPGPSKEEFDKLKEQVDEMMELLKKAKAYDEKNNEPDCEIEEKMDFLRKVAALVGVDLTFGEK